MSVRFLPSLVAASVTFLSTFMIRPESHPWVIGIIISKLEEMAKQLKLKVKKKDDGLLKMDGLKEGRNGILSIDAEIFQITPTLHRVEVKKSNGDTLEYQKMLEDIRAALR